MQFQNNFDLEEFLAYLLPGFLCSIILYVQHLPFVTGLVPKLSQYGPEYGILFIFIVVFVTVSLTLGHICSLFSRGVLKTVLYIALGDPERSIFPNSKRPPGAKNFYTPSLTKAIASRFKEVFRSPIAHADLKAAAPRMIRAYVLLRSPGFAITRERIVRGRSLCGNLVLPILIAAALFYQQLGAAYCVGLLVIAALLTAKQMVLDIRESKEIYTAFLGLDVQS